MMTPFSDLSHYFLPTPHHRATRLSSSPHSQHCPEHHPRASKLLSQRFNLILTLPFSSSWQSEHTLPPPFSPEASTLAFLTPACVHAACSPGPCDDRVTQGSSAGRLCLGSLPQCSVTSVSFALPAQTSLPSSKFLLPAASNPARPLQLQNA